MTQNYRKTTDPAVVAPPVDKDEVKLTVSFDRGGIAWYLRGLWMGVGMAMGFSAVSAILRALSVMI